MMPIEIAVAASILATGALLQSAVGFGLPLVSVPLLLLAGHSLPTAVSLSFGAALMQAAHGCYIGRDLIRWRLTLSLATIQWVTVGLGVAAMGLLVKGDPARVTQAVGALVVLAVTALWVLRPEPRDQVGAGWGVGAAATAGFMGGLVGIPGPPMVLFAMAHRWAPDVFRSFLWSQFLLILPVYAAALTFWFGLSMLGWFGLGVALAPVVWVGSWAGRALTRHWNARRVRIAATIVLYAIGVASLLR